MDEMFGGVERKEEVSCREWLRRKWRSLDGSGVSSEEESVREWIIRVHDPDITLLEVCGLLHGAFGGYREASPIITRHVLAAASMEVASDPDRRVVQARAERSFALHYLHHVMQDKAWWRATLKDRSILSAILGYVGAAFRRLQGNEREQAKALVEHCVNIWWEPTDSHDADAHPQVIAGIREAMPALVRLADKCRVENLLRQHDPSLDYEFWRERAQLVFEAYWYLALRRLGVAEDQCAHIARSDARCAERLVLYCTRRRARVLKQIEELRVEIQTCREKSQEVSEKFRQHFLDRDGGIFKRESNRLDDKVKATEVMIDKLEKELQKIPQF